MRGRRWQVSLGHRRSPAVGWVPGCSRAAPRQNRGCSCSAELDTSEADHAFRTLAATTDIDGRRRRAGRPLRYEVVSVLAHAADSAERHCSSFGLPVSKSTRSHHFRVLREAGLIRQVDRGNSRMARLRADDLEARFPGLLDLIRKNPPQPRAGAS
ncbi:ArsR/SmtB family transcription factor [Streptomyces sp. NPDC057336]|uniref:ArsR/SmtB family transcription factor n=1 Tax=Streptomyces sp. NPDC057336 TaxID=3346102 RepID=UPI00362E3027